MSEPSKKLRFLSVFWAILLGVGVVAIGGSILLPSTKRARFDFQHQEQSVEAPDAATSVPAQ